MPAVICPIDLRIACRALNSGETGLTIDELAALLAPLLTQDLQDTYDAAPTEPQILLDTVPNPLVVQAATAGEVFGVHDVAGNEILQVTANPDQVNAEAGVTITDAFLNAGAANSLPAQLRMGYRNYAASPLTASRISRQILADENWRPDCARVGGRMK